MPRPPTVCNLLRSLLPSGFVVGSQPSPSISSMRLQVEKSQSIILAELRGPVLSVIPSLRLLVLNLIRAVVGSRAPLARNGPLYEGAVGVARLCLLVPIRGDDMLPLGNLRQLDIGHFFFLTFGGNFFPLGVLDSNSFAISGCLACMYLRWASDLKGISGSVVSSIHSECIAASEH